MKQNNTRFQQLWLLTLILAIVIIFSLIIIFQQINTEQMPDNNNTINKTQPNSCPRLSNTVLEGYNEEANAWVLERLNYKTSNEEIVYIDPPSDLGNDKQIFYCDLGSKHIELGDDPKKFNPDYVYCGDFIRPIVLYRLDTYGNIIESNKTSIEIVFNSKTREYVETLCGTYELTNIMQ